jgi:hypothetical protein
MGVHMVSDPWNVFPQHPKQRGDKKKRRKSSSTKISKSSERSKDARSPCPNSPLSVKDEKQSLHVESEDGAASGGSRTAAPRCLAEGAENPNIPEVAIPEITPVAPRRGSEKSNVSLEGVARVPVSLEKVQPSKKGWFGWGKKKVKASAQSGDVNAQSKSLPDRQVVQLLGPTTDLTRGKGDNFGVKAVSGNRSLKEQSDAARARRVLNQRKKSEVERGGLFHRGQIQEHAPVGPRKFGVSCGCF